VLLPSRHESAPPVLGGRLGRVAASARVLFHFFPARLSCRSGVGGRIPVGLVRSLIGFLRWKKLRLVFKFAQALKHQLDFDLACSYHNKQGSVYVFALLCSIIKKNVLPLFKSVPSHRTRPRDEFEIFDSTKTSMA
jgi:hypothetical protein